ncbi:PREDICTED: uncharacterized protein LOC109233576 [Nicotiana attenuata]|uniref:uncharacterized protein LOC109233576 n=1 Tax=Nicotiana attenuata TaxID=49451 RepID=UPI00090480B4|nr:PREDICTED: uncharacterized protein LOC109233576 [Nicotiana attenuata]
MLGIAHEGEDLFHGCFTGVEDNSDLGDASSIFDEAQRLLSQALTLHWEAFSKSRVELNRCEADLKRITEERDALKILSGQVEEEIKYLRAILATAHKEQTNLIKQKAEKIEQLREEANMMKAETLGWKQYMDRLASEKDTARAQLSWAERQLQSMKEEILARAKKIKELEARLDADLAKATSEVERVKAEPEAIFVVYRADAKAAQARARDVSRRETLEEIHACGFNLAVDIENAKVHEVEAKALLSSSDDDSESASGGDSGDEDAAPKEN